MRLFASKTDQLFGKGTNLRSLANMWLLLQELCRDGLKDVVTYRSTTSAKTFGTTEPQETNKSMSQFGGLLST